MLTDNSMFIIQPGYLSNPRDLLGLAQFLLSKNRIPSKDLNLLPLRRLFQRAYFQKQLSKMQPRNLSLELLYGQEINLVWIILNQSLLFDVKFFTQVEIPIKNLSEIYQVTRDLQIPLSGEHDPGLPADSAQDAGSHSPALNALHPREHALLPSLLSRTLALVFITAASVLQSRTE